MVDAVTKFRTLAPFLIEPAFVKRIWGTTDLRPWYDFVASDGPVGEVWLTGDDCKIASGELAGKTLGDVFSTDLGPMIGNEAVSGSPLLLKVIFAKEKLSVQVHPDDKLAQKYGQPRGKTECWYALAAEPGAEVAAGLLPGVTLEAVEAGVADGTLEKSLDIVPVEAGEMIFVDAGTVHAIWPGSVLLETQQNCDLTYRLYDYGRPRELHVAKALEAIRLETDAGKVKPEVRSDRTVLVDKEYFVVEKIKIDGSRSGESMLEQGRAAGLTYLFAGAGSGRISSAEMDEFEPIELQARGIAAIPATSPAWRIEDLGGLEVIRITPRTPGS
jgi:mannose-6-phosphate isomerase